MPKNTALPRQPHGIASAPPEQSTTEIMSAGGVVEFSLTPKDELLVEVARLCDLAVSDSRQAARIFLNKGIYYSDRKLADFILKFAAIEPTDEFFDAGPERDTLIDSPSGRFWLCVTKPQPFEGKVACLTISGLHRLALAVIDLVTTSTEAELAKLQPHEVTADELNANDFGDI